MFCLVSGCGSSASSTPDSAEDPIVPRGTWTLSYQGICQIYEAEMVELSHYDDEQLIFDDHVLIKNEDGHYVGRTEAIAAMPEDGRDIPFTIDYRLTQDSSTKFSGEETTIEGGGREDACPLELVYIVKN